MAKNKFCCNNMKYYVEDNHNLIDYDKSTREYSLILYNDLVGSHQSILFCPWCGTKLPKDLNEEWELVLEKEYGILARDICCADDLHKIPKELQTDKWWKKRGL